MCGGDFPPQAIKRSINTTSEVKKVGSMWIKVMHNTEKERHKFFYVETQIVKKTQGGGEGSTIILKLQKLQRICWYIYELGSIGRKGHFSRWRRSTYTELSAWRRMGWWPNLRNCMICTCWFVVTVVIVALDRGDHMHEISSLSIIVRARNVTHYERGRERSSITAGGHLGGRC